MSNRTDFLTITFTKYQDPLFGIIKLGLGRYSINIYKFSVIVECWWMR